MIPGNSILTVSNARDLFRLNVGFIIHQTVGYFRDFEFEVDEFYQPPDLRLSNLTGVVRATRTAQGVLLKGDMRASTLVECVRCLTEFSLELNIDFTELYAFSANSVTESDLIMPDNGVINLEPIFREEMLLAIPISPFCREDCKGLCPICGENQNETTCQHEQDFIDPRLNALKSLLEES